MCSNELLPLVSRVTCSLGWQGEGKDGGKITLRHTHFVIPNQSPLWEKLISQPVLMCEIK